MAVETQDPLNRGPGDAIVTLCNIISTDGKHTSKIDKEMWHSIILFESMELMEGDFPFIVGEVNIVDSAALFNEMRFSGDEIIELKFKTPQKQEISFKGKVFNISAGDVAELRLIKLKFCSAEKLYSDQIKFNRSYRNVLYSDMARDMFNELKTVSQKELRIEPSKNMGSVVVNNKSPIQAINMIKKVAKSADYMGSNYVFYESIDKEFQFISLESLIDPAKRESTMIYYDGVPPSGVVNKNKLKQIISYSIQRMPDVMGGVRHGMFAGTVVSNDLLKRQVKYKTFNYDETYNNYKSVNYNEVSAAGQTKTSLSNNKKYSSRYDSNIICLPTNYKSHDTETSYGDDRADTFLIRNSQLQQICAIQLRVIVPGDSQRRVGEIVELVLPSRGNYAKSQKDITFSGRYLITKIKHMIASEEGGYTTIMILSKDSYEIPLPVGVA
jgi:hypothetical protein